MVRLSPDSEHDAPKYGNLTRADLLLPFSPKGIKSIFLLFHPEEPHVLEVLLSTQRKEMRQRHRDESEHTGLISPPSFLAFDWYPCSPILLTDSCHSSSNLSIKHSSPKAFEPLSLKVPMSHTTLVKYTWFSLVSLSFVVRVSAMNPAISQCGCFFFPTHHNQ